jgi:hypothetical protein
MHGTYNVKLSLDVSKLHCSGKHGGHDGCAKPKA